MEPQAVTTMAAFDTLDSNQVYINTSQRLMMVDNTPQTVLFNNAHVIMHYCQNQSPWEEYGFSGAHTWNPARDGIHVCSATRDGTHACTAAQAHVRNHGRS